MVHLLHTDRQRDYKCNENRVKESGRCHSASLSHVNSLYKLHKGTASYSDATKNKRRKKRSKETKMGDSTAALN